MKRCGNPNHQYRPGYFIRDHTDVRFIAVVVVVVVVVVVAVVVVVVVVVVFTLCSS